MKRGVAAVFFLAVVARALYGATAQDGACLTCHEDVGANFKASAHADLGCTGCHTNVRGYPHPANARQVDCATCHADNVKDVKASVHASVNPQPCVKCHGGDVHSIRPAKDPKSATYPANLPKTCGGCHGTEGMARQFGLPAVYSLYMDSIHGFALTQDGLLVAASCSSCHGSHKILSGKDPNSRTSHANIPSTCGTCHAGPKEAYYKGVHGKALEVNNSAPVCTNCHTTHQISNVRTAAWQMKTAATCGECHEQQFKTYHDTFHAQVSALGYVETAHCWDCHGHHDILPASDPKSMVAPANRAATCGKCHTGSNASFATYQPHADSADKDNYPLLHYSAVFMNLLLSSVLGFFALHTTLWFFRTRFDRAPKAEKRDA